MSPPRVRPRPPPRPSRAAPGPPLRHLRLRLRLWRGTCHPPQAWTPGPARQKTEPQPRPHGKRPVLSPPIPQRYTSLVPASSPRWHTSGSSDTLPLNEEARCVCGVGVHGERKTLRPYENSRRCRSNHGSVSHDFPTERNFFGKKCTNLCLSGKVLGSPPSK